MDPPRSTCSTDDGLAEARWAMVLPFSASLATRALMGKVLQRTVADLFVLLQVTHRGTRRLLQLGVKC